MFATLFSNVIIFHLSCKRKWLNGRFQQKNTPHPANKKKQHEVKKTRFCPKIGRFSGFRGHPHSGVFEISGYRACRTRLDRKLLAWPFHPKFAQPSLSRSTAGRSSQREGINLGTFVPVRTEKTGRGSQRFPRILSGVGPANQTKERPVHELFPRAFRNKSST